MTPNILSEVVDTVRALNDEQRKDVLEYAKRMRENNVEETEKPKTRKLFEKLEELRKKLPADAWDNSPTDGSFNHDHYLYGSPKRQTK